MRQTVMVVAIATVVLSAMILLALAVKPEPIMQVVTCFRVDQKVYSATLISDSFDFTDGTLRVCHDAGRVSCAREELIAADRCVTELLQEKPTPEAKR